MGSTIRIVYIECNCNYQEERWKRMQYNKSFIVIGIGIIQEKNDGLVFNC